MILNKALKTFVYPLLWSAGNLQLTTIRNTYHTKGPFTITRRESECERDIAKTGHCCKNMLALVLMLIHIDWKQKRCQFLHWLEHSSAFFYFVIGFVQCVQPLPAICRHSDERYFRRRPHKRSDTTSRHSDSSFHEEVGRLPIFPAVIDTNICFGNRLL